MEITGLLHVAQGFAFFTAWCAWLHTLLQ